MVSTVTSSETTLDDKPRSKAAPISAHKAFPAMVALWFAALFGFGSLVLPAALVERAVETIHADALLPVLASPLGVAARALIALVALILGGVLGLVVARRIAQAQRPDLPEAKAVSPVRAMRKKLSKASAEDTGRKPFSIRDELDGESDMPFAAEEDELPVAGPAPRRRALAIEEDEKPRFAIPDVPLPGAKWPADTEPMADDELQERGGVAAEELPQPPAPLAVDSPALSEPDHELAPLTLETVDPHHEDAAAVEDAGRVEEWAEQSALAARLAALTQGADADEQREDARAFDAPPESTAQDSARIFDSPSPAIEPVQDAGEPDMVDLPVISAEETPAPAPAPSLEAAPNQRSAVADRPLAELNVVELVERLACAISARNSGMAGKERTQAQPLDPALSHPFAVSQEDDRAAVEPSVPSRDESDEAPQSSQVPLALRPLVFEPLEACDDGQDDEESEALFSLPSFMPGQAFEARDLVPFKSAASDFGPPVEEDADDELADAEADEAGDDEMSEAYSSLLGLRSVPAVTVTNGFVRIEEPEADELSLEPAVVFPGRKPERAGGGLQQNQGDMVRDALDTDAEPFADPVLDDLPNVEADAGPQPEADTNAAYAQTFDSFETVEPGQPDVAENEPDAGAGDGGQETPVARLFDAPADAAQGEEKTFPLRDSGETERALRAALANLQRMGGAG